MLIIRILLFRVLPIVGNSHLSEAPKANPGPGRRVLESPGTVAGHATSQTPGRIQKVDALMGGKDTLSSIGPQIRGSTF